MEVNANAALLQTENASNSGTRPDELRPGGTALQANAASNYSNQVLLDGIDDTEMVSHTFVVRPAVEGVQEFKVLTNNAGAEYGRAGGAVVVVTSKSEPMNCGAPCSNICATKSSMRVISSRSRAGLNPLISSINSARAWAAPLFCPTTTAKTAPSFSQTTKGTAKSLARHW